jgi:hypothetical protein
MRQHGQEKALAELAGTGKEDRFIDFIFEHFNKSRLIHKVITLCNKAFKIRCAVRQFFSLNRTHSG